MWRRTLDSWGYSPLDEISKDNVADLRLVWTRDLATGTGEITPLAYNGMLFVPQAMTSSRPLTLSQEILFGLTGETFLKISTKWLGQRAQQS